MKSVLFALILSLPATALAWDEDYYESHGYPPAGSWSQEDINRAAADPVLNELREIRQQNYWRGVEAEDNQKAVIKEMKRQNEIAERRLQLEKDRQLGVGW